MPSAVEKLLLAAGGDVGEVRTLLREGADVNCRDSQTGDRPLHRAAMEGRADIVQVLVQAGADPKAQNAFGDSPLHWAADGGHANVVRLLMRNGADPLARNADGKSAIDWAADSGHTGTVALLRASPSYRIR